MNFQQEFTPIPFYRKHRTSPYFLTQRIKPVAAGEKDYDLYLKNLADHHAVMVAAMKVKQNVDPKIVASLRDTIDALAGHYDLAGHEH